MSYVKFLWYCVVSLERKKYHIPQSTLYIINKNLGQKNFNHIIFIMVINFSLDSKFISSVHELIISFLRNHFVENNII